MIHPIQCECGCVQGTAVALNQATRITCFCKDCQAFAHFLGNANAILDDNGGTDIVQTSPKNITFSQGAENLACVRLTEKGMIRWYASCCKTPIGNTLPSRNFSFIGLIHNCLNPSDIPLHKVVGETCAQVNTGSAKGDSKPKSFGTLPTIGRNILRMLKDRINGSYQQNLFFLPGVDEPIAVPKILDEAEYESLESLL
ncbi:MAG: DUF6151 family protein [Cyanobacteria bacterium P01_C01_bin.89]